MKIHHLNLCTMCPFGGRLIDGRRDDPRGGIFRPGSMVVHALLVETARDGLVLVDTGMGLADVAEPARRIGRGFLALTRPKLAPEHTAIRQVERLGFRREDVRHVVVTHLDADHAGGLADFPDATVHVHRRERDAAEAPRTSNEKQRYRPLQLAHGPKWQLHDAGGEAWFGFERVRAVADDVFLVPLPGHTRGHSAVAVRAGDDTPDAEWLLHCGDAYFSGLELERAAACPPILRGFQALIAVDDRARRANADRLRALHRAEGSRVRMFSAHCPRELAAFGVAI